MPLKWVEESVGVPWKAAGVPKQTAQGFWIDLFIPLDSPPGPYQGQLVVLLDAEEHPLPIHLEVWPFAIPDECSMVADMNAYAPGVVRGWEGREHSPGILNAWKGLDTFDACGTAAYRAAERNTFRCAHDHRALYHYLPYGHSGSIPHPSFIPELAGEGKTIRVKSWAAFDQHFGGYLDGSAFRGTRRGPIPLPFLYTPQNFHWPADFARFGRKGYRRIGAEFVEHFRSKGWTRTRFELFFNHKQRYKYFPWDGDEIKFLEDTEHMYLFRDLSAGVYDAADPVQFIWRVDSSWVFPTHCKTDLGDFVKLWVVNSGCQAEAPEGVKLLHERGCSVFHYGGAAPLDAPLSWVWQWPLRTFGRGNDGFTWWLTTGWDPDIWHRSQDNYATCVFYPASPWGRLDVLGGIRAKALRNAMQTIEYAALLDRKRGPGSAIALVNQTLGTSDDTWWGGPFAADPLSWDGVRRRLASSLIA